MKFELQLELSEDEVMALLRFEETCEDGQSYDVPTPMMKSLAKIGVLRRVTSNIYETTAVGDDLLEMLKAKNLYLPKDLEKLFR